MNRTDDIASLFDRFGGSSDAYHEFDSQLDYKEPAPTDTQPQVKAETLKLESPVSEVPETSSEVSVPAVVAPKPTVEAELPAPIKELELSTPAPVAEVALPTPAPDAEVALPTPTPVAEVALPTPAPDAEVALPTPAPVAEVALPTPAPVAEVELPMPAPVAETEPPKPMAIPVIVPLARSETVPVTSNARTPLRNLLAEVKLARQAEEQAAAEEAQANARPPKSKAHIVAVVSSKGGVGKTTLSAALAGSLHLAGGVTLCLDLDPQNALYYSLGTESGQMGIANAARCETSLRSALQTGFGGAQMLPYGALSDEERRTFEHDLAQNPHWLAWQLHALGLSEHDVVIMDTPTGHTPYLQQALDVADEVIVVTTADAASFITLDQMDRSLNADGARPASSTCHYVVNRFDASRELSRDMLEVFKRRLGKKLMAVVAQDNTFDEALAYGHDPLAASDTSVACQDVQLLAQQLKSRFVHIRASGLHA